MGLFDIFKRNKINYGGIIESLNLQDFWSDLEEKERQTVRDFYNDEIPWEDIKPVDVDSPKSNYGYKKGAFNFLENIGKWASGNGDYLLSEKLLLKALEVSNNYTEKHAAHNSLIDMYYKQRDENPSALDSCIYYCIKDIEIVDGIEQEWFQHYSMREEVKPPIPSFKRLAIIFEKQGKLDEAIEVCERAVKYKLDDGTKGGFEGRIRKLKKNLL